MDTSPEYIQMCAKAVEIQELNNCDMGSWFYESKMGELCILIYPQEQVQYGWAKPWYEATLVSLSDHDLYAKDHHAIWLPRQDQLQKMTRFVVTWTEFNGQVLYTLFPQITLPSSIIFLSLEQLWLAFVMKEKYGKVWHVINVNNSQIGQWVTPEELEKSLHVDYCKVWQDSKEGGA